jgi:hypothetical protein
VTWRTCAADLPVRGSASGTSQDRSVHVPGHALMAVAFRLVSRVGLPPEKRKVGGSTPPLTTKFVSACSALICGNVGSLCDQASPVRAVPRRG